MKNNFNIILILFIVFLFAIILTTAILGFKNNLLSKDIFNSEGVIIRDSVDVYIQDQTTKPFDIQVNRIINDSYSLSNTPIVNSYNFTLDSVVGLSVGDKISLLSENGVPEIYFGFIKSIDGNVITLNDPVPFPFVPERTFIFSFDNQLNVDGSDEPVIFSINNYFDDSVDITRLIFKCTGSVEMHDGLFCDIDALTNGILFRKKLSDDTYINYFNIRNNAEWGLLAYDVDYTDKGKPPDDTYGFGSRLTYAGNNKHGVAIRLAPGESIELLVQDDLTDISSASLMVEGHFVD